MSNNLFMRLMLGDRMRERAVHLDLKDAEVARRVGISPRRYGHYVENKRKPDYETLLGICRELLTTPNYLLGFDDQPEAMVGQPLPHSGRVAEIDSAASAAYGQIVVHPDHLHTWGFPERWVGAEFNSSPESLFVMTIIGDGMPNVLDPGTKALVNSADKSPSTSGIFVYYDGRGVEVRRMCMIRNSRSPTVRVTSTRPDDRPEKYSLDDIKIFGRVIGRWCRL